jgi:hypothetical protein
MHNVDPVLRSKLVNAYADTKWGGKLTPAADVIKYTYKNIEEAWSLGPVVSVSAKALGTAIVIINTRWILILDVVTGMTASECAGHEYARGLERRHNRGFVHAPDLRRGG